MDNEYNVTIRDLEYWDGTIIPRGTRVVPADNLPQPNDSNIAYWAEPWEGMTEAQQAHMRTYGYGIEADDVRETEV